MAPEESIPTDYEIAQSVEKHHIRDVVEPFGLEESDLDLPTSSTISMPRAGS